MTSCCIKLHIKYYQKQKYLRAMQEMQECKEQERCCSRTCKENTAGFDFWNPRCASSKWK